MESTRSIYGSNSPTASEPILIGLTSLDESDDEPDELFST